MQSRAAARMRVAMGRPGRASLWIVYVLLACGAAGACRTASEPVVVVHAEHGPVAVRVELATTPAQQARGLMWRDELEADAGMLFVFERAEPRVFWMKNTPVSLDIIYIGDDKLVVAVASETTPFSTRPIPSGAAARYVLEVPAGFARRHGVKPGVRVDLPAAALPRS